MLSSVKFTISEYIKHRKLLFNLSYVHMSQSTIRSTWGVMWVYIHDILYFTAFTLFRILLTGNRNVNGMYSAEYLMTGLVPWLLISEVLNSATNAIRSNKVIIQSIKFPIVILPGVEVLAILLKRLPTYLFIFVICTYYGHLSSFNPLLFIYYLFSTIALLFALTLILSAIIAISEDFHQFYLAMMRILFFSLPIMWDFATIDGTQYAYWGKLLRLNPLIYLIQGTRDAFVTGPTQPLKYTCYFWIVVLIIFLLGCYAQKRLQKFYADFV